MGGGGGGAAGVSGYQRAVPFDRGCSERAWPS